MTAKILSNKSGYGNGVLNGASYNDPRKFLQTHEYKNLTRWTKEIGERPAVKRGRMVNRTNGPPDARAPRRQRFRDKDGTRSTRAGNLIVIPTSLLLRADEVIE